MENLRLQLSLCLAGRVAWVALGNPDRGDDAVGPVLAARLEGQDAAADTATETKTFARTESAAGFEDQADGGKGPVPFELHHVLEPRVLSADEDVRVPVRGKQPVPLKLHDAPEPGSSVPGLADWQSAMRQAGSLRYNLPVHGRTVWQAGLQPERCLHRLAGRYDHVVFLDATDFGGAAGDVVFLAGSEIRARFPQISTHRLALGMLAAWVESDGRTRAWLLGVQPANLGFGARMTPAVAASVEVLAGILTGLRSNLLARDVDRDSDPLAEDDQGAGAAPAHSGDAAPC